jgi:hypothetical protein
MRVSLINILQIIYKLTWHKSINFILISQILLCCFFASQLSFYLQVIILSLLTRGQRFKFFCKQSGCLPQRLACQALDMT